MPVNSIPPPSALLVDPKTGIINKDWYDFFRGFTPTLKGTWVPDLSFDTPGSFTSTNTLNTRGHWTRIGSLVLYGFTLGKSFSGEALSSASGSTRIIGLPFKVAGGDQYNTIAQPMIFDGTGIIAPGFTQYVLVPQPIDSPPDPERFFYIYTAGPGTNLTVVSVDNMTTGFGIIASGFYWTND